jgi:hypothetical protein
VECRRSLRALREIIVGRSRKKRYWEKS